MQAKKRYILVFLSCAFLAYCYFGGYRLKQKTFPLSNVRHHKRIITPSNLPSFLSLNERNGLNEEDINNDINGIDKIASFARQHTNLINHNNNNNIHNNDDVTHQGSQLQSATLLTNIKSKGMCSLCCVCV